MRATSGNADVPVGMGEKNAIRDTGAPREWYSRGYLPHRDRPHLIQSVTYRLADSLPRTKLETLKQELAQLPEENRDVESRRRIERWLDAGMGCCALKHPEVARYVQDSFLHFHGEKYELHAWCIMPNHVHILVEPFTDLATIIQGWKSFTARWILQQNQRLGLGILEGNHLWMREYWDRFIRDAEHYYKTVEYIHENPVKAGLCQRAEDWLWSSYRKRTTAGNADVLVSSATTKTMPTRTLALPGNNEDHANEDVGLPGNNENHANEDVGAPRNYPTT